MKLRERFQRSVLGGDQEKKVPQDFNGQLIYFIRHSYLRLIGLNLVFVISCLGIVTIPAAATAMMAILRNITGEQVYAFWPSYWKEFKNQFFRRLILWLLMAIAPFSLAFYTTWMGLDRDGTVTRLICIAVLFLLQSYWYTCMALIDTTPLKNLKNAAILMAVYWKKSLCILASAGVLCAACFAFPLYGIPVMVIGLFSLSGLIILLLIREPVCKELCLSEDSGNEV